MVDGSNRSGRAPCGPGPGSPCSVEGGPDPAAARGRSIWSAGRTRGKVGTRRRDGRVWKATRSTVSGRTPAEAGPSGRGVPAEGSVGPGLSEQIAREGTRLSELPMDENRRRFRRPLAWGLVLSVGLHLAAVLALPAPAAPGPGSETADRRGEPGRAARGTRLLSVRSRRPVSVPSPPPPIREPEADVAVRLPETEVDPPSLSRPRPARSRADGAGTAAGEPTGRPVAAGDGGGAPAGDGFMPPAPRSVAPEWDPPGEVRGQRVTLRIHVDARGRPTGPVELHPPTSDASFNRRLIRKARRLRFRPARRGGRPVAAWAELTFVF